MGPAVVEEGQGVQPAGPALLLGVVRARAQVSARVAEPGPAGAGVEAALAVPEPSVGGVVNVDSVQGVTAGRGARRCDSAYEG